MFPEMKEAVTRLMEPSRLKNSRARVAATSTGQSRTKMVLWTAMGRIRAMAPRIMPRLKTLEPTTLAREMPGRFFTAAVTVTRNSGAEVPMATTVRPMTSSETLSLRARAAAPTTMRSAPNHNRAIPAVSSDS